MKKINFDEVERLSKVITDSAYHPLSAFLSNLEKDNLIAVRKQNLDAILDEAKRLGLKYLYIETGEFCGCEGKADSGGTWPAIWALAKNLGFPGSCGNHDQYQVFKLYNLINKEDLGGWDVLKRRKLSEEELKTKKFNFVVSRRDHQ